MVAPLALANCGLETSPTSTKAGTKSIISSSSTTTHTPTKRQNSFRRQQRSKRIISGMRLIPNLLIGNRKFPKGRIVKSSIPTLNEEIQVMTQDAPFIATSTPDDSIVLFDRNELQVNKLLGQGQFSKVFSVSNMELLGDIHVVSSSTTATAASGASVSREEEQGKRQAFVEDFCHHRYAIKHLKRDMVKQQGKTKEEMLQQFQLAAADLVVEALYLSRLNHPNILKVRGMANGGTQAFANGHYDSFFLILDKLSESLDQRIRKWRHASPQPQESHLMIKTYYALQMAQALAYLHEKRIIFRDLKPQNIGFKEEGDALQIFDFGLCRELPVGTENGNTHLYYMTAAGTHRYMAVEVLMGKEYNLKADVYSLAMVYYECLAQEAPFRNFSDTDHHTLVCERRHRPHHFFGCVVPQSIQRVLGETWEHEVDKRLTMQEAVTKLEDVMVNTFQQTLKEGPQHGVKVLHPRDHRDDEKSSSSSLPTSQTTLASITASTMNGCSFCNNASGQLRKER